MEGKNCSSCDKQCGTNLRLKPDVNIVLDDIFDKVPEKNTEKITINLDKILNNEELYEKTASRWNYGRKKPAGGSNFSKNLNKLSGKDIKDFMKRLNLSNLLNITAHIGYFKCYTKENSVLTFNDELQNIGVYTFRRSDAEPHLSVADFFFDRSDNEEAFDISTLFHISLGQGIYKHIDNLLYTKGMYKEVFQVHGLLDSIHEVALLEVKKYILSKLFNSGSVSSGMSYSLNDYSLIGEGNIDSVTKLFKDSEESSTENSNQSDLYHKNFYDNTYIFSYHNEATDIII